MFCFHCLFVLPDTVIDSHVLFSLFLLPGRLPCSVFTVCFCCLADCHVLFLLPGRLSCSVFTVSVFVLPDSLPCSVFTVFLLPSRLPSSFFHHLFLLPGRLPCSVFTVFLIVFALWQILKFCFRSVFIAWQTLLLFSVLSDSHIIVLLFGMVCQYLHSVTANSHSVFSLVQLSHLFEY